MDESLRGRHVAKKRQVSNVGHDDYRSPSFQNKTAEDPCSGFKKWKERPLFANSMTLCCFIWVLLNLMIITYSKLNSTCCVWRNVLISNLTTLWIRKKCVVSDVSWNLEIVSKSTIWKNSKFQLPSLCNFFLLIHLIVRNKFPFSRPPLPLDIYP